MWIIAPVMSLGISFWFIMRPHAFDPASVSISLILVGLVAWVAYLESRALAHAPTRGETTLATAWLWLRRFVAYGAAAIFLAFSIVAALYSAYGPPDRDALSSALTSIVMVALGVLAVRFGRVGRGQSYDVRQDASEHEQRKRKYGWKW